MDATTANEVRDVEHEGDVHVVDKKILVGVLGTLVVLTILTVAVTKVDLGVLNLWVAMGIAAVKAILVAMYFMHLRYDDPFHAIVFVCAVVFLVIFIGLALLDTMEYQHQLIPGHAPALER